MLFTDEEYAAMLANLTATQERCNTLLEEARAARAEKDSYRIMCMALAEELKAAYAVIVELHDAFAEAVADESGPKN